MKFCEYNVFSQLHLYEMINEPAASSGWKLAACERFNTRYKIGFANGAMGINKTKKQHSFLNVVGAKCNKILMCKLHAASDAAFGCGIRAQKQKDKFAVKWDEISLPLHLKKPRSKGTVFIRYVKLPLIELGEQMYRHHLSEVVAKGCTMQKSLETMKKDLVNLYNASESPDPKTRNEMGDINDEQISLDLDIGLDGVPIFPSHDDMNHEGGGLTDPVDYNPLPFHQPNSTELSTNFLENESPHNSAVSTTAMQHHPLSDTLNIPLIQDEPYQSTIPHTQVEKTAHAPAMAVRHHPVLPTGHQAMTTQGTLAMSVQTKDTTHNVANSFVSAISTMKKVC